MRVAICGARGFIGKRLSVALAESGHDVVAISSSDGHFDAGTGLLTPPPVPGVIDAVVYLSQSPRYRETPQQSAHLWAVNVVSPLIAAEWGRSHGARQFVYASSGTIYSPTFQPHPEGDRLRRDGGYPLSKVHAEEALQQFAPDMRVACARCFSVYGPHQHGKLIPNLIASIRAGRAVQLHPHPDNGDDSGGVRLSLIHVDDAAAAFVKLIETSYAGPINIASPDVLPIRRIAEAVGTALGVAPMFAAMPDPRDGDVIADASRLAGILNRPFKTFTAAIGEIVAADLSGSRD